MLSDFRCVACETNASTLLSNLLRLRSAICFYFAQRSASTSLCTVQYSTVISKTVKSKQVWVQRTKIFVALNNA